MFGIPARNVLNRLLRRVGYECIAISDNTLGRNPFRDMRSFFEQPDSELTIFDVGANEGQTIPRLRGQFPRAMIHAFEPNRPVFKTLQKHHGNEKQVRLNPIALGASVGVREFHEYETSDMSSFFKPGASCWSRVSRSAMVRVDTVDTYCDMRGIQRIDVLKLDTQGSEVDVVRGAARMLAEGRVYLVYLEVVFEPLYIGQPGADQVLRVMSENDLALVAFYKMHYRNWRHVGWTDALFVRRRPSESLCTPGDHNM